MKKQFITICIIAVIALTVISAAGIVTSHKAAADQSVKPIDLVYAPGAKYSFTGDKLNARQSGGSGTAVRIERMIGNKASAAIYSRYGQTGVSKAGVGMLWRLSDADNIDWTTISSAPVKITLSVHYTLSARGGHNVGAMVLHTAAGGSYDLGGGYSDIAKFGDGKPLAFSGMQTHTFTGKVSDFFSYEPTYGYVGHSIAFADSWANKEPFLLQPHGLAQLILGREAGAHVVLDSITIEFGLPAISPPNAS